MAETAKTRPKKGGKPKHNSILLGNGMEVCLDYFGEGDKTDIGENVHLLIKHPSGKQCAVTLICGARAIPAQVTEPTVRFRAYQGTPLKYEGVTFLPEMVSFHPTNLASVSVEKGGLRSTVVGIYREMTLEMVPSQLF
jgi:hypothetical protein